MFDLYSFNVVFISVVSVLFGVSVHLPNKVLDLCAFLNQSAPSYNLFGDTESRLDFGISDQDTNIPDYRIQRKDSAAIGQTGIAVCIHDSIADITHRCHDLENDCVECIWVELKPNTNTPSLLYAFCIETLQFVMNGSVTLYR